MRTADFDFDLPPALIAQVPAPRRGDSRLLVLHRDSGKIEHRQFPGILEYVRAGDVLVLNNSRVIPARLRGVNAKSGGAFEMLLLEENGVNDWWAMLRPGKRARIGTEIKILSHDSQGGEAQTNQSAIGATVIEINSEGHRRLRFSGSENIFEALDRIGEVPLPPYIERHVTDADRDRYQTVYANPAGSVAAPTAGLHFTEPFLDKIRARGVEICFVTLHVGPGTFISVKTDTISEHKMHEERFELSEATADLINRAKQENRRIIAVGTTTVRVLETVAANPQPAKEIYSKASISKATGKTHIFIYPPYSFKIVDVLLTNFHLPKSTLLMLVSAFAAPGDTKGRDLALDAYREAIHESYRFFSYGDAMLIL